MAQPIDPTMTTTAFSLDGYRTTKTLGVVRGVTVRSRSVLGTLGASLQTLVGGNITLLTELCEKTRGCVRAGSAARAGAWSQQRGRAALRRDRGDAGRHRSVVLRHRRDRHGGMTGPLSVARARNVSVRPQPSTREP